MSAASNQFAEHGVLVIGAGSIGRRHMSNLRNLGVRRLAAVDPDRSRLPGVVERFDAETFEDLDGALESFKPNVVFICTPPVFHVPQALLAIRAGADVFIEKPLSNSLECVPTLKVEAATHKRVVQVGYNLRFQPGILTLKRLVEAGVVGRIFWVRVEVAQYLPDWRPWQDYRLSYTARRELGGGIILDASHEIDYLLWLLGPPRELTCMAGKVSTLDVDVEDCATILIRFCSGAQADVHMDFAQRTRSRTCLLAGDRARLEWDYAHNEVHILRPEVPAEVVSYDFEPNQMYVSEVEDFFSRIEKRTISQESLAESELALKVALGALSSASERKWVSF